MLLCWFFYDSGVKAKKMHFSFWKIESENYSPFHLYWRLIFKSPLQGFFCKCCPNQFYHWHAKRSYNWKQQVAHLLVVKIETVLYRIISVVLFDEFPTRNLDSHNSRWWATTPASEREAGRGSGRAAKLVECPAIEDRSCRSFGISGRRSACSEWCVLLAFCSVSKR